MSMRFWSLIFPWRDARRYRVVREEMEYRWILGTTVHSAEELDQRVDFYLAGGNCYPPRREEPPRPTSIPEAPSNMPGLQPLWGDKKEDE